MLSSSLLLLAGLVILYLGAESMVRGASALAISLGISAAVVGLTVVAYGTSAPELVVGVIASAKQQSELVYGNVIGSNIANLALVLGIGVLIRPLPIDVSFLKKRIPYLIFISGLFIALSLDGGISRYDAALFLVFLGWYLYREVGAEIRSRKNGNVEDVAGEVPEGEVSGKKLALYGVMVAFGIAGLVIGAEMMVRGALDIARALGVSERVIGITVVALGTSLPELAATVVAAIRKESGLLFGSLIGSNIFNILIIIGVCASISPIDISLGSVLYDFIYIIGLPMLLFLLVFLDKTLRRSYGGLLVFLYLLFMALLFV